MAWFLSLRLTLGVLTIARSFGILSTVSQISSCLRFKVNPLSFYKSNLSVSPQSHQYIHQLPVVQEHILSPTISGKGLGRCSVWVQFHILSTPAMPQLGGQTGGSLELTGQLVLANL